MSSTPALDDHRLASIPHEVVRHGPARSLEEAAAAREMSPSQLIKTMVVRRGADDYLFVLVPGDRVISWPKLRSHLGVNRLSMPDADEARAVTGYERGTITPLGSERPWPVVADSHLSEVVSLGGGAHGVSVTLSSADLVAVLGADLIDVTEPV
ncbi:MAG TPA: YbaK/EbsC family protein [Acidimicrobiia bacterium]|nr:YbaK/EbsC family protein [Acidimicrobiia bacterium]